MAGPQERETRKDSEKDSPSSQAFHAACLEIAQVLQDPANFLPFRHLSATIRLEDRILLSRKRIMKRAEKEGVSPDVEEVQLREEDPMWAISMAHRLRGNYPISTPEGFEERYNSLQAMLSKAMEVGISRYDSPERRADVRTQVFERKRAFKLVQTLERQLKLEKDRL